MVLRKLLLLAVVSLMSANIQAQDLKILVNNKGKVGFADAYGNEVVKCQYESAMPFSDGTAIVMKANNYGIIDTKGNELLPLKYTQIQKWNEQLYLIKSGKDMGLADHNGKIVLPVNYSNISKVNCYGKALIALGGKVTTEDKKTYMAKAKYGIIDASGTVLVEAKYNGLYEFAFDGTEKYPYYEGKRLSYSNHTLNDTLRTDCDYLGFSDNAENVVGAGIIDGNGRELLRAGLYDLVMKPQSDMVRYYILKKAETECGYHNLTTDKGFHVATHNATLSNMDYWSHSDFVGNIAAVNSNEWFFIDKNGNKLRSGYKQLIHGQTTNLWAAKKSNGTWDVFDDGNNDVKALSGFTSINFPRKEGDKEVFCVKKGDKYGYIDRSGKVVIPFKYDLAGGNNFDLLCVKKDGKWGALTPDNKCVIPIEFTEIYLPSERNIKHLWVEKADGLSYHINIETQKVSKTGYKKVWNFVDDMAFVVPENFTVPDNQLNRALLCEPNAKKETMDALNMAEHIDDFGCLLNTDDVLIFNKPISRKYKSAVVEEIKKLGRRTLTESDMKNILLEVTSTNRSYNLKAVLSEEEWNY